MKKQMSDIPKPYLKKENGDMWELMEDLPPYLDRETAVKKRKVIRENLEIKIRIIPHNNRFFLYRAVNSKRNK